jgi:hypothetical protein
MRVDDALRLLAGPENLGMDKPFSVRRVRAVQLISLQVQNDKIGRPDLFESKTKRFHQDLVFTGNPQTHVAQGDCPLTFLSQDPARQGKHLS